MQELVWALLAVLLFAIILVVGFNITLKDFLKTRFAKNLLFSAIICVGLFALAIGTVVLTQARADYESGNRVCNTTVYNDNLVEIGKKELIEGVEIPVYDETFAKAEKDKCLGAEKDDFVRKTISSIVFLIVGAGLIITGTLALCGKIWNKNKKKSKRH